jgi:hypothetical protein
VLVANGTTGGHRCCQRETGMLQVFPAFFSGDVGRCYNGGRVMLLWTTAHATTMRLVCYEGAWTPTSPEIDGADLAGADAGQGSSKPRPW